MLFVLLPNLLVKSNILCLLVSIFLSKFVCSPIITSISRISSQRWSNSLREISIIVESALPLLYMLFAEVGEKLILV